MKSKERIGAFVQLHLLMLVFSLYSLFAKLAAPNPVLSFRFLLFEGLAFLMLGIYAIFFQQILKKMKLTIAYSNKAVVIVWVLLWSVLFFQGTVTWGNVLGLVLIIAGIWLMVSDDG